MWEWDGGWGGVGGTTCTMGNKFKFALSLSAVNSGLLITPFHKAEPYTEATNLYCVLHFAMAVVKIWLAGWG